MTRTGSRDQGRKYIGCTFSNVPPL